LGEDVGGGAKAVQAEAPRAAGHPQRAVADQPGAQQRRGLRVGVAGWDLEAEALVGERVLGHAAVDVAAGEARQRAEVLAAGAAVGALAAGPPQPGDADAAAIGLDGGDDLVAEDPRRRGDPDLAVEQVQVGAAHPTGLHLQQQLAGRGHGDRALDCPQRLPDFLEHHRPHCEGLGGGGCVSTFQDANPSFCEVRGGVGCSILGRKPFIL
jgi:hypothetical protein